VKSPASRRAQRGMALLGLLAVMVMVFAYVLTSRLNAASRFVALDREQNASVMAKAKRALIGYVAQQAAQANERNPGRLPCPEAVNAIGTTSEGIAAPLVTPSTPNCATVGRLPWRTLGLEKLVDAAAEPLWYVVSPGWRLQTSSTLLTINPDSVGTMSIDGAAAPETIALIIAPGPAMNVQAAAGCTARAQARAVPAPSMDSRDYLECFNAATPAFFTTGPATSFNDQVLRVTTADVMPALEAAIQVRAQREIASAVRSGAFELDSNSPRRWISTAPLPSAASIYPYPVPFTTPTTSLSNFRGAVGTNQGLMPFAQAAGFVSFQAVPADVIKTTAPGKIANIVCYWESATVYACEGDYEEDKDKTLSITVQMTATFSNVAMGFRARNTAALTAHARDDDGVSSWSTASVSTSKRLELNDGGTSGKPRGSVTATLTVTLPNHQTMGWGKWAEFRLRMNRNVVADHPLLSETGRALGFSGGFSAINNGNTVTGATSGASGAVQVVIDSGSWPGSNAAGMLFFSSVSGTFLSGETLRVSGSSKATAAGTDVDIGWFARNEWYRNVYYAVAAQNIPDTLPSASDCDSSNCLRYNAPGVRNTRALLVIAGRRLDTQLRPSSNFANYVEYENADNGTYYEQHRMTAGKVVSGFTPWNDRLVIVDWITPTPTFPIAYLP
jgi:type II secretory pathway pseudopilin PulG